MFKLFNICYIKLYLILSQKIQLNIFLFSNIYEKYSSKIKYRYAVFIFKSIVLSIFFDYYPPQTNSHLERKFHIYYFQKHRLLN